MLRLSLSVGVLLPSFGSALLTGDFSSDTLSEDPDAETGSCKLDTIDWQSIDTGIGMDNQPWLPVSYEIEMYFAEDDKKDEEMLALVKEGCASVKTEGSCSSRMNTVDGTGDHAKMKDGYVWEKEIKAWGGDNCLWEISSPIDMTLDETELSCRQLGALQSQFTKDLPQFKDQRLKRVAESNKPGFHAHVHGKCLLEDERRLVALILVWDKFFAAIQSATKSVHHEEGANRKFADRFATKNPDLVKKLKSEYIGDDGFKDKRGVEALTEDFNHFEKHVTDSRGDAHNGYRRYVLNVCHLLDVHCAFNWPKKNSVPKFGGIEFRGFDAVAGENLRLTLMLLERTVQLFCGLSIEDLFKLVKYQGFDPVDDATELFKALGIKKVAKWTGF